MSFTHRVLIVRRDVDDPYRPAGQASTQMVVYFPDGCPATRPAGLVHTGLYCQHAEAVCPGCIDSWTFSHFVSDPTRVPTGTPTALRFTWATVYAAPTDADL
ncbi:hypothetical protein E0F15_11145 [Frankia sp. B2]|uniref:hypothetical protein n=1 Tax=Frankia sp. B2 TaxID=2541730 RepID=UPI001069329F|nr:hypothetical protein [Frankia sp. B2]TFE31030.1 hypothetical protein E0F15_11145 [Frankia sp. B2]